MGTRQGLSAILGAIRRRWALCLLVAVPIATVVGIYAQVAPAQYDAQTTVAFAPRPSASIGADVIRVVLPRYVSLLKAQATVDSVALGTGVSTTVVDGASVVVATDTANLLIVVRDTDPVQAAKAANALAERAIEANQKDTLLLAQQVAPALPPQQPSAPARSLLMGAGLLGGLIVGLAVAILAERSRPRVWDDQDVLDAGAPALLGRIPSSRALARGRGDADPALVSALRGLMARTERAAAADSPVLGVTSPPGAHGRSTVALALATAAARQNRTVIVVQADIGPRGAALPKGNRPDGARDLTGLLSGEFPVGQWLTAGPVKGVTVLPIPAFPGALDLLASGIPGLLERLADRADLVILDCPPVDDDGEALLVHIPAVVLVIRSMTSSIALARCVDQLEHLGAQLLGVALNRSDRVRLPSLRLTARQRLDLRLYRRQLQHTISGKNS